MTPSPAVPGQARNDDRIDSFIDPAVAAADARRHAARRVDRCACCGRRVVPRVRLEDFLLIWIEENLGVTPVQLRSTRRYPEWIEARVLATWALRTIGRRRETREIAEFLAPARRPRTLSTVLGWDQIAERRRHDPDFQRECANLAADFAASEEMRYGTA